MKINRPFQSHSISRIVANTCLLILVVSLIHIVTAFSSYESDISEANDVNKLYELKISIHKLQFAVANQTSGLQPIALNIEQKLAPSEMLQSSWFHTQSLNKQNAAFLQHWKQIKQQITDNNLEQIEAQLHNFLLAADRIIEQHKILAQKKIALVHFLELVEFLLIVFAGVFLFYYSKNHITHPLQKLIANVNATADRNFDIDFPNYKNEMGELSQSLNDMSEQVRHIVKDMRSQFIQKAETLEKAEKTIKFLLSISRQLSSVKLTSAILQEVLNELAEQANLRKVCLELNNGTFINSALGCASLDPDRLRIPIIINTRPYGFLNYVPGEKEPDHSELIECFSELVAHALYQEEHSSQAQKLLLIEERGIIARELHDSIAQSLSFLKIQCNLLHRQIRDSQQTQAEQTVNNIEDAVSDASVQLRSLLSTFRLTVTESNFKEAMVTVVNELQKLTAALISIKEFDCGFDTDASQHIHLLQIVREAIINAIKHAKCTHIDISCIIDEDNNVCIRIVDNGKGSQSHTGKKNHYGLSIMKQRADELGARLSVTPLTRGTEVKLIFPYK